MDLGLRLTSHFDEHPEQRFALLVPVAVVLTAWAIWRMTALFALPEVDSVSHIIGAVLIGVLVLGFGSSVLLRAPTNWRRSAFLSLAILAAIAVVPAFGHSAPSTVWADAAVLGLGFWGSFGLLLLMTGIRTKSWQGNGPWFARTDVGDPAIKLCGATFRIIATGYAPGEVDQFLAETRQSLESGEPLSKEEIDAATFSVIANGYSVRAVDTLLEDLSSSL